MAANRRSTLYISGKGLVVIKMIHENNPTLEQTTTARSEDGSMAHISDLLLVPKEGGNVPSAPTSMGVEAHGPLQGEAEGRPSTYPES